MNGLPYHVTADDALYSSVASYAQDHPGQVTPETPPPAPDPLEQAKAIKQAEILATLDANDQKAIRPLLNGESELVQRGVNQAQTENRRLLAVLRRRRTGEGSSEYFCTAICTAEIRTHLKQLGGS